MKNKFSISQKAVFLGSLSFTVVSVILRTLSMLLFFDSDIGYFRIGAVLPVISNLFLTVGVIGFFVLALIAFGSKKQIVEYGRVKPFQIVGGALGIISALFLSVSTLPAAVAGDKFAALCSALAFTGGLYFPCTCFRLGTVYKLITGISLIARITCMMGVYYFNQDITMNAPDKIIFCIACIFGMWFIISEVKAIMGVVRPWMFVTASTGAAAVCATASLPTVIKLHADKAFSGGGYAEYWLLLAIAIYALSAVCSCSIKEKMDSFDTCDRDDLINEESEAPKNDAE